MRGARGAAAVAAACVATAIGAAPAPAATTTLEQTYTATDGVAIAATVRGEAPLVARPTVVEFTPYGTSGASFDAGPAYNHVLVQIRGTGSSDGDFDALGPRTQADVREVLGWACHQPWSTGELGLNGFSASAIAIYNSLHLELPCVKAAVMKSGTHELYRDLLYPGGISNAVPGLVVLFSIGAPAFQQRPDRGPQIVANGAQTALNVKNHTTLDTWWGQRGFRGDVNHLPILMVNGFFDVESRGAFEAYQELKGDGAHLIVVGAHDERPAGTDGGAPEMRAWLDRYVRGVDNGVEDHPRVQMLMSDGDRKAYTAGTAVVRRNATDWPVPKTRWRTFTLDAARSGTATSLNDGTLTTVGPAATTTVQPYPAAVSAPTNADVPNAAILDASGLNALTNAFPALSDMRLAEPLGLSYTSAPLTKDLLSAGPAALRVTLASTAPTAAIWAVISDVGPDGVPHPLTVGRLSTDFPDVDAARSRRDTHTGEIVQPYGVFDHTTPATPGQARSYQVEFWPLGNRFRKGHRVRLHLVGSSLASLPGAPGVNLVTVGGPAATASRLLVPVLPAEKKPKKAPARRRR